MLAITTTFLVANYAVAVAAGADSFHRQAVAAERIRFVDKQ